MDPTIVAEIIKTAGKAATRMIQKWDGQPCNNSAQRRVDKVIKENYDKMRTNLTNKNVKILISAECGKNFQSKELREKIFPNLNFGSNLLKEQFDKEFEYRLSHLTTIGLLAKANGEYYITRLGASFIREARERKDYYELLFLGK